MFKGRANPEAARAVLERKGLHPDQRRMFCGIPVSSLAVGTYLGPMDEATDHKVTLACLKAIELGVNFIDTAINYRGQRAERTVGEAFRRGLSAGAFKREEIFVSTKCGFVPYEGAPTRDIGALFEQQYVAKGIARKSDLIAGCHCMEPAYLRDQIERSRKNLQLETIDLLYVHNPETQLEELPARIFYDKLEKAFEALEGEVRDGKIAAYGMATWDAFRDEETAQTHVSLEKCVEVALRAAKKAGSREPHFKAVQLPLNLAMPEAALMATQEIAGEKIPAIEAAKKLGLSVALSVPLFQSRLCHGLPDFIVDAFPKDYSQAHCALAFATSFSAVDCAMLGMKQLEHVEHNLRFLKFPRLAPATLNKVIEAMVR